MIEVLNNGVIRPLSEAVFFSYDTYNVPLLAGLSTSLIQASKHHEPVVRFGGEGEADQHNLRYFGSVIKVDGQYRMWYLAGGDGIGEGIGRYPAWRPDGICYAVSDDGVRWEKPSLGLVDYHGSRDNNLVDLDCAEIATMTVVHDPEDPDPDRRFKIIFDSTKYGRRPSVAFSADGLRWRPSQKNPVLPYRGRSSTTPVLRDTSALRSTWAPVSGTAATPSWASTESGTAPTRTETPSTWTWAWW